MKPERLGPYQLEKILGRGGMGAVYVGRNVETGDRAAVKVLNPVLADDRNFRERFKLEVETLKKLLHPNIVQLFAFGEQDDHLFYVMELVEGRSLQDELLAGRRFQWREVARIGIDVAHALKHAHDRGVIHRDLKPANLLVDPQEHAKLTDFGIAKLYGGASFTADGGVLGTADYMAPEQAEGKPVTHRCDLYSLGSVLYALLTGRPPFAGKSLPEVIQGLRFEKPVPLHRLNPNVPEEFENIVNQLLEKDPQKRIPTAIALANRLKAMVHALSMETRVADGEPAAEVPSPPPDPQALSRQDVTRPLAIQTAPAPGIRPTMPMPPAGERKAGEPDADLMPGMGRAASPAAAVTLARAATMSEGDDPAIELQPPPEKKRVFTTVSKDELGATRSASGDEEHPLTAWLKIGGLATALVVLAAAFWYYATLPPDADAIYERIKKAALAEELTLAADDVARFLATFPDDPRAAEVESIQDAIERSKLQGRLERQARNGPGKSLSPIEREYLQAMRLSASDPAAALARFQALVDAFSGSQDLGQSESEQRTAEQCLVLARQQVKELRQSLGESVAAEKEWLARRLAEANELAQDDPEAANKIRRGIVVLYGDKEWARDLIAGAQAALDGENAPK